MKPESATKHLELTKVMDHETENVQARAIPLGSYAETAAANALVLIALGTLLTTMFSKLFSLGLP